MTSRQRKIDILNRVLHDSVNSVLQYVENSTPYIADDFRANYEAMLVMRDEEAQSAHDLTDLVNAMDGVPKVGVFPYWNIDINYLDARFMARFSAEHIGRAIAELETEIGDTRDDAKVFGLLTRVLAEKKGHHAALAEMAGLTDSEPEPEPADTES